MGRKLRRSKHDKVLAGVCGGIAEYFNIDSTIIRLGFVLMAFPGGLGFLAYIVGIIIMPGKESYRPDNFYDGDSDFGVNTEYDSEKDFTQVMGDTMETKSHDSQKSKNFVGISLIVLGVLFLIREYIPKIDFIKLIPVLLVLIGVSIVFKNGRK